MIFARVGKICEGNLVTTRTKVNLCQVFLVDVSIYKANVGPSEKRPDIEYLQKKCDG